ncbi:hypothetical protein F5Y16DRAFT_410854 [Xylariaceae sp. FL0255]|nr:hypothetical protein F5Y16DRAFT_410854 [Xylariaceae sp. FL0255]
MQPTRVHMVGSVPGASSQDVFTRLTTALPGHLQTVPDGETGERSNYIAWQLDRFPAVAHRMELGGAPLPASGPPSLTVADIKPTRYDDVVLSSYAEFKQLRYQRVIPSSVRFQISLPSPYSVMAGHLKPEMAKILEPFYEQHFAETLDHIVSEIPHEDMVIQWDLCFEITALEYKRGRLTDPFHKPYISAPNGLLQGLVDRIVQFSERVPQDIKFGFHLCYGDLFHKHFLEPPDLTVLVDFANSVLERDTFSKRTEWIHMPVPKDRTDPHYLTALNGLNISDSGSPLLFLGFVHANDEAGTRKRIETAQFSVPFPFGVATECSLGRTPPEELDSIFQICKVVTTE